MLMLPVVQIHHLLSFPLQDLGNIWLDDRIKQKEIVRMNRNEFWEYNRIFHVRKQKGILQKEENYFVRNCPFKNLN